MRLLLLAALFGSKIVGAVPVDAAYEAAHSENRPAWLLKSDPNPGDRVPVDEQAPKPSGDPFAITDSSQTPLLGPLRWTTSFPDAIEADATLSLSWVGGYAPSGFEVFYIPTWPGQRMYHQHEIANTTDRNTVWSVPSYDFFPEDTTFIIGVKDGTGGPGGEWYDLTGPLPFVHLPDATEFEAAIAGRT
ncbi:hypothetical protein CspeluHIS016_0405740 [Cutaneotrichosporon spelunceum]|uniref:Uncharacterized protein n=1 Tax=Cutaneotrichosporon spelunceum TaxID=1672016 RepID=A0AAD3YC49_9TREE|nr:hypothetical protein CspeluHIS016_0405740 [Cutaneotrichosporon spelunceum]